MKIAIASDHAGFQLKSALINKITLLGHEPVDLGACSPNESVDYPDFAAKAAEAVRSGKTAKAIVVCGSGVGACVAANKFRGIRAAVCHDTYSAHQGVEHDDMNVLCLGARIIGAALAEEITKNFIEAAFSKEPRYVRRLEKIISFEQQ